MLFSFFVVGEEKKTGWMPVCVGDFVGPGPRRAFDFEGRAWPFTPLIGGSLFVVFALVYSGGLFFHSPLDREDPLPGMLEYRLTLMALYRTRLLP